MAGAQHVGLERAACAALRTGLLVTVLWAALGPWPAAARCTTRADLQALAASVSAAIRCRQRQLRLGPRASCRRALAAPDCAAGTVQEILTLAFAEPVAAADPSLLAPRRRCQDSISRGANRFVARRLRERAGGQRRQTGSRRSLARVARWCGVVTGEDAGGVVLPRVGGACAPTIGAPGTAVDAGRLARCLRAALERIVDDVAPVPLRPDIVVILTDDQRWDTLGWMPHVMRQLVGEGASFSNAFVTTSLCCPSRASLYSGQYAHHHGVLRNGPPDGGALAFRAASALPVWLAQAGYTTALFGKYMNGNRDLAPAVPPGWTEWQTFVEEGGGPMNDRVYYDYTLNENGRLVHYGHAAADYSTDLLRERVVRFIRSRPGDPIFVVYAPFAPHHPAVPARRHAGRLAGIAPWRPPSWKEPDVSDKPGWVRFMAAFSPSMGTPNSDTLRIHQLESLLAVDDAVPAILAALERLGLADETLVVFTSDNGYMWGEHWWIDKLAAYEESIRVPLVLRYPALVPLATTLDAMALNIDLAPTFAEAAGVDIPVPVDGRSLLGLLRGEGGREDFLIENYGGIIISPNVGVRSARWKLIRTLPGGFEELYDLLADPYELDNRAAEPPYADVRAALAARLDVLRTE